MTPEALRALMPDDEDDLPQPSPYRHNQTGPLQRAACFPEYGAALDNVAGHLARYEACPDSEYLRYRYERSLERLTVQRALVELQMPSTDGMRVHRRRLNTQDEITAFRVAERERKRRGRQRILDAERRRRKIEARGPGKVTPWKNRKNAKD